MRLFGWQCVIFALAALCLCNAESALKGAKRLRAKMLAPLPTSLLSVKETETAAPGQGILPDTYTLLGKYTLQVTGKPDGSAAGLVAAWGFHTGVVNGGNPLEISIGDNTACAPFDCEFTLIPVDGKKNTFNIMVAHPTVTGHRGIVAAWGGNTGIEKGLNPLKVFTGDASECPEFDCEFIIEPIDKSTTKYKILFTNAKGEKGVVMAKDAHTELRNGGTALEIFPGEYESCPKGDCDFTIAALTGASSSSKKARDPKEQAKLDKVAEDATANGASPAEVAEAVDKAERELDAEKKANGDDEGDEDGSGDEEDGSDKSATAVIDDDGLEEEEEEEELEALRNPIPKVNLGAALQPIAKSVEEMEAQIKRWKAEEKVNKHNLRQSIAEFTIQQARRDAKSAQSNTKKLLQDLGFPDAADANIAPDVLAQLARTEKVPTNPYETNSDRKVSEILGETDPESGNGQSLVDRITDAVKRKETAADADTVSQAEPAAANDEQEQEQQGEDDGEDTIALLQRQQQKVDAKTGNPFLA